MAENGKKIVEEARDIYRECVSSGNYTQSHIWEKKGQNISFLRDCIKNCRTPEALENWLNNSDIYGIRCEDKNVYEYMLGWHINLAIHKGIYLATDRYKTPGLIKSLIYCNEIQKYVGAADFNILELGGGNGKFLRVAHETMGVKCVDVDIPESLFCAYVYLRHHIPSSKILFITEESQDFELKDYDFVLCPTNLGSVLFNKKFDVFVNTFSMGEMNNETVRMWIDLIENKLGIKYFYGVNRYLNIYSGEEFRKNENESSVLFDSTWNILEWDLEPDFTRCPYEDGRAARCLRVFMERVRRPVPLPMNHLQEIMMEDWFRYRGNLPSHSRLRGQLVHDFGMEGTLFKLWQAIRKNKSPAAVSMMLEYLNFLSPNKFEEEFYYRNLLLSFSHGQAGFNNQEALQSA